MEILGGPDVPRAPQTRGFATNRHIEIHRVSLTVFSFPSKRTVGIPCSQQQFIAQPLGIVSGNSERGGEHAGFVFAFLVDGIKRVVAQFCHVHENMFGIGKLQRGKPR
jgi:hypothetical protein